MKLIISHRIRKMLFLIGIILMIINIAGLFTSLRNPEIFTEDTFFDEDITLTEHQVFYIISERDESDEEYAIKINNAVHKGLAHYWSDEGIEKYNLRIPLHENYLLNIGSYLIPNMFEKYEYCDYRKALERGVGLCSQHAIVLAGILKENGIESQLVELSGHIVVLSRIDNKHWILDPDYGVVIEHDLNNIEKNPSIIKKYYEEAGYDSETIDNLEEIYGKDGNGLKELNDYCWKENLIEFFSYLGIWVIALLFFLPFSITYLRKRGS